MTGEDFVPPSDAEVVESEFTPPSDAVEVDTVKKKTKNVEPVNKFAKDYIPEPVVSSAGQNQSVSPLASTEPFDPTKLSAPPTQPTAKVELPYEKPKVLSAAQKRDRLNELLPKLEKGYQEKLLAEPKKKEQLPIVENQSFLGSVENTISNVGTRLEGAIPRLNILAADVGDKLLGKELMKDYYKWEGRESPEKIRSDAYKRLDELDSQIKQTHGLYDNLASGNIKGVAAGVVDAVGNLASTAIPSLLTLGAGLFTETIGQSVVDYNKAKAEAQGISVDELYKKGQADLGVPAALGTVSGALEKVGLKGIDKAISRNLKKEGIKNLALILKDVNHEGWTEWIQTGLEAANIAKGQGLNDDQIADAVVNDMFSKKGLEAYLMGVAASGAVATGAQTFKAINNPQRSEEVKELEEKKVAAVNDLANPNVSEEAKQALVDVVFETDNKIDEKVNEDVQEYKELTEEGQKELNNTISQIDNRKQILSDPNISEESKKTAQSEIDELYKQADKIITKSKADAIQERGAAEILPSEQEKVRETGSERVGVGQVEQGQETTATGEEKVANIESKPQVDVAEQPIAVNEEADIAELESELLALKGETKDGVGEVKAETQAPVIAEEKPTAVIEANKEVVGVSDATTEVETTRTQSTPAQITTEKAKRVKKEKPSIAEIKSKVIEKVPEAQKSAKKEGVSLKVQKADLLGQIEKARQIFATIPNNEDALKKGGFETAKSQNGILQVVFEVEGDGTFKLAADGLDIAYKEVQKHWDITPQKPISVGTTYNTAGYEGKNIKPSRLPDLYSNIPYAETIEQAKQIVSDAKTNLETANKGKDQKLRDFFAEELVAAQKQLERTEKGETEVKDEVVEETVSAPKQYSETATSEDYYVPIYGNEFKKVKGKPVENKYGVDLFIHKDKGNFDVAVARTGQRIASGKTEAEAIEKSLGMIENAGVEKTKELIKKREESHGASPRYEVKSEATTAKNIKEKSKKLAAKIREGKLSKKDQLSALTPAGIAVDLAIETAALTVEAGGTVAQAIADGIKVLKESEAYKKASDKLKALMEELYQTKFEKQVNEFNKINEEKTPTQATPPTSNINDTDKGEGKGGVSDTQVGDGVERGKQKRKLTQQFLNDKTIRKEFKEAVTEETIYYDRLPNDVSLEEANKMIDMLGEEEAKKAVLDLGNNMKFAVRMIMGQVLIKKMNEKGYDEQAVDFVKQFVAITTDMGQGIQALSLFDKLTPEGQVKVAKREAKKQRDKNLKNDKRKTDKIKKAVKKANEEAAEEVVEKVKKKINKVSEIPPISSPKYGEKNKIVTKSEYEKLLKELRGNTYSNVDPRIVKIAAFHIEAGAREFGKFSENMTKALGKKVKPYLKDLYKQAQDLFESKEGFTTDEQIAQLELEQKGQEIKEKISKALKSGNKKSIESAIAEIYRNGELWGRYKDMAVNRLKRMSVSEIKSDVSGKAILDEFTTGLIKNIRQQAEKVGDKSSQKKEAIQIIADAYKNFEKYQEVWAETQKEFKEKYSTEGLTKEDAEKKLKGLKITQEEADAKLAELDAYFGDILLKPFSEKLVAQAVKEGLKSLDIKIADIIKDHYTVYEAKKKELVDKLIDEANLSPTEARELAAEIEKEFDKLATEKKKQYLDKIFSSKERKKPNVKQLYEKIIEATNVGVLSDSQLLDLYADKMGYGKLTPEQANEIVRLANKVHEAPKGHLKFQAIEDLLKYQMNLKQTSWYEVPQAIWYANMLSGHQTHQRNLVANIANTMFLYSNAFAQHPTDAVWMAKSLVTGIKKGLLEASDVMTTGYSPIRGKMEIPPILERKTFEGIMYPLNIAKYVRRLMVASDVLLFEGQKEMRSYQLAANMARKEGKTDPTLNMRNRALELMNNIDGALDEAITIANSEMDERIAEIMTTVTDPNQQKKEIKKAEFAAKRRAYELLEKFRPESIQEQAANFAARGTYNYTPEGALGVLAKWVNNILGEIPLARYAVPFTNIIANVTNDALNYTPYGFLRWGTLKETGEDEFSGGSVIGKANSKEFNKPLTEQEKTDLLTKAIIGTSFMAFMWLLSSGGDDDEPMLEITANGTGDWRKNLTLREGGWQPYSVRVKNPVTGKYSAWMSYQYSPLMLALGYIGNIRDFEKYRDEKISDNMLSKYAWASAYSARSLFDMSFLSSANDAMSAFADPRNPEKAEDGLRAALKTGKTFVIPNAYTQSAKTMQDIMDWAQKESRGTVMGYVLRDIPVARDMYNNQVNYLGEDVTPDSDVIISGETPSKEWALLIKNNSFGSAPHPTKDTYIDENDNQEKAFSQEQFFRYAKERGYIIKKFLNENYDYLSKLNKEDFKKIMEHVQGEATVYAKINSQGHNFEPDFTEYMNTKKGLNLEEATEPIVLTSYEQYFKKQSNGVKEMLLREIDSQKKNDEYLDKGLISQELYNKVSE